MTRAEPGRPAPRQPSGRVADGTHPVEVQRLALQEQISPHCVPLTTQAFLWLNRAYSASSTRVNDTMRSLGLSMSGFNVLMALQNTPGSTLEPRELSERLLVTRPSVTGLLDTLQARGLIARAPHEQDKRRVVVTLTDAGRALLRTHVGAHYQDISRLFADLNEQELDLLVQLLRRVEGAVPSALAD